MKMSLQLTSPVILATVTVATLASLSLPAFAATIAVDSEADDDQLTVGCTLRAAIAAANLDAPIGGCPAGSGPDTIIVQVTPILGLNKSLNVQSEIEIIGGVPLQTIIGGASPFVVERRAALALREVKLTGFTGTAIVVQSGWDLDQVVFDIGHLELIHSELSGNDEAGALDQSSAIANEGGDVGIFASVIQNNNGGTRGAAVRNAGGTLFIRDSSFIASVAAQAAGAIQNMGGGFVSLSNVTISGDQQAGAAGLAGTGALWNGRGSTMEIDFSTITAHGTAQPGIRNEGIMTIRRSIISGSGADCRGRRRIISGGFNLVGDCPGLQMTVTDISGRPGLAPLTDGLQVGDVNSGQRYHMPLADSPAIDAIPAAACDSPFYDQRWKSRSFNGACEIGAIEAD